MFLCGNMVVYFDKELKYFLIEEEDEFFVFLDRLEFYVIERNLLSIIGRFFNF